MLPGNEHVHRSCGRQEGGGGEEKLNKTARFAKDGGHVHEVVQPQGLQVQDNLPRGLLDLPDHVLAQRRWWVALSWSARTFLSTFDVAHQYLFFLYSEIFPSFSLLLSHSKTVLLFRFYGQLDINFHFCHFYCLYIVARVEICHDRSDSVKFVQAV